eukprot:TRINITY_DN5808_c0_g1_i2.p1 TRINITY_DN5808_c0_g1~~TRINITY_DN5808_c0_g1_i2.p1  ORF type:complete len:626 (+),score=118.10 TRINITY_DN5808_c0_g1_i2:278-1879(+)
MGTDDGEDLPNDNNVINIDETLNALAVDWDGDVLRAMPRVTIEKDDSLKLTEDDAEMNVSLNDCLSLFTQEEELSGDDAWRCGKCKKNGKAKKQINLWRVPPVLILHLKRFQYTHLFRDKLTTLVSFPIEKLDLAPCMSVADGPVHYDLCAVSHHMGTLNAGHYIAHARNIYSGDWFKLDDNSVSKVEKVDEEVVKNSAYLLFYVRREDCTDEDGDGDSNKENSTDNTADADSRGDPYMTWIKDYLDRVAKEAEEAKESKEKDAPKEGTSSSSGDREHGEEWRNSAPSSIPNGHNKHYLGTGRERVDTSLHQEYIPSSGVDKKFICKYCKVPRNFGGGLVGWEQYQMHVLLNHPDKVDEISALQSAPGDDGDKENSAPGKESAIDGDKDTTSESDTTQSEGGDSSSPGAGGAQEPTTSTELDCSDGAQDDRATPVKPDPKDAAILPPGDIPTAPIPNESSQHASSGHDPRGSHTCAYCNRNFGSGMGRAWEEFQMHIFMEHPDKVEEALSQNSSSDSKTGDGADKSDQTAAEK